MDYGKFFSADVPSFMRSPVREIFRKVDLAAICSFAGGYPSAEAFPVDDIKRLSSLVLEKYGTKALQYGATQGVPELREAIAGRYGVPLSRVQITTSSQQGIDVCSRILLNPGDIVLSKDPTYLGALQSFKAYRAGIMSIDDYLARKASEGTHVSTVASRPLPPAEPAGPSTGKVPGSPKISRFLGWPGRGWPQVSTCVPSTASSGPGAKFIYVIPDFNNPSGESMSLQKREEIVRVARELDLLIVEDSPYREVRYGGEPLPTIWSMAPERTLHLGSFSKIFAPGFRLGWIIGPEELLEQIYVCKQALDLCPPVFDQYLSAEYLSSGALDRNLEKTITLYRHRRDKMLALLEKYMPEGVSWTRPDGGLFLFLTLPEGMDTVEMYDEALSKGVAYVAGSFFFVDGSHRNTMRLNYTFIAEEKMEPGVRILSEIIKGRL